MMIAARLVYKKGVRVDGSTFIFSDTYYNLINTRFGRFTLRNWFLLFYLKLRYNFEQFGLMSKWFLLRIVSLMTLF